LGSWFVPPFNPKNKHGKTLSSVAAHVLLVFVLQFALCAGDLLDFGKMKMEL